MRSWLPIPSMVAGMSLIFAPVSGAQGSDWGDVSALRRGQEIALRADPAIDGRRSFVFATDTELVVLHLRHPSLPDSVRKRLREMSIDQPASLLAARGRVIVSDRAISVGAGVISESGRTLVPLHEVLQTIPRGDVREIRIERTRGSKVGAAVGATAGLVAGILTAPDWMMKQCGGSCGDEQFMLGVSLVGLPIAGALTGYLPHKEEVIVYQSSGDLKSSPLGRRGRAPHCTEECLVVSVRSRSTPSSALGRD